MVVVGVVVVVVVVVGVVIVVVVVVTVVVAVVATVAVEVVEKVVFIINSRLLICFFLLFAFSFFTLLLPFPEQPHQQVSNHQRYSHKK